MVDDLVARIGASTNFGFLARPALELAEEAVAVEAFVYSYPHVAVFTARLFCEKLVKALMRKANRDPQQYQNHYQRIQVLAQENLIPDSIAQLMHDVRVRGNTAVHEGYCSREDALATLRQVFTLSAWWYHAETGLRAPHSFTVPSAEKTASLQDLAESLESINDRLARLELASDADFTSARGGAAVLIAGTRDPSRGQGSLDTRWQAGEEGWLGDRCYVLQDDKSGLLRVGRDFGEHIRRQALARQIDPEPEPGGKYVWLRQGGNALTGERNLLIRAGSVPGLPRVVHHETVSSLVTLALSWQGEKQGPPCATVHVKFARRTLNEWQVHLLLQGLASLARPLGELHRLKTSHRNLTPDGIIDVGNKKFALRDAGLAATRYRPGEGPENYQAPEQAYGARMAKPGPATDVYQLAAIAYHLITGRLPSGRNPPPARHEGLADPVTSVISAALAEQPADRPQLREFSAVLRSPSQKARFDV